MLDLYREFMSTVPTERTVLAGDRDEVARREGEALEISARMDALDAQIRAAREQDG